MKKFLAGVILGILLSITPFAVASQQIHLLVNGNEIVFPEAPPQIINGRTMVPARPLAEALGAKVDWDNETRTVIISSENELSKPLPTAPTTNEWISLNKLSEQGFYVMVGDVVTIKNGDDVIEFPRPLNIDGIYQATPELKIMVHNARFLLSISDLQAMGFLP